MSSVIYGTIVKHQKGFLLRRYKPTNNISLSYKTCDYKFLTYFYHVHSIRQKPHAIVILSLDLLPFYYYKKMLKCIQERSIHDSNYTCIFCMHLYNKEQSILGKTPRWKSIGRKLVFFDKYAICYFWQNNTIVYFRVNIKLSKTCLFTT